MFSKCEESQDCSESGRERLIGEFTKIWHQLLGFAAKNLDYDWHRAEDIVQDAFIKLYSINNISTITSPRSYFRKMIINLIHDFRRKKENGCISLHQDLNKGKNVFEDNTVDKVILEDIYKLLSEEEFVVIQGWARYGYTFKEIGEMINKSPDAIRMIYSRAKKKIMNKYRYKLDMEIEDPVDDIEKGGEELHKNIYINTNIYEDIISIIDNKNTSCHYVNDKPDIKNDIIDIYNLFRYPKDINKLCITYCWNNIFKQKSWNSIV